MTIHCSVISDVGLVRKNNEDNFYVNGIFRENINENHFRIDEVYTDTNFLGAVFDGMGGENNGELASLESAKLLKQYQNETFEHISFHYVNQANQVVCNMMEVMNNGRMGSTLAIVKINDNKCSICNVGDSPIYLFQNNRLDQVSVNHNEAQSLYDIGLISKEELKTSKKRHRLTQHLGIFEDEMLIEPYTMEGLQVGQNDSLLLCSDGLVDMVNEDEIEHVLSLPLSASQKTKMLLNAALDNGGRDNITIMLICFSK